MIITIRNQIKHSMFRYVAFFIVIVLGAGMISIPSLMRQGGGTSWAVKVNGEKVSYQELAHEIAEQSEFLAQIRAQYGQYADLLLQAMGWPNDPKVLAIEILIKSTLMNQLVKGLGISIHADYITESINNAQFARRHLQRILPPFVFEQTGRLNPDKLKMFLQHKGISIKSFEAKIEQSLAQLEAMQFIGLSTYVPLFDIQQEFIANKLSKQFSYLAFSFDSFLSSEKRTAINDEDARIFYDKENIQRRRYWVPEKRDGTVWKFSVHNYNAPISEEQINEYYEDNKVSKYVLEPLKVEVRQITEKQLSQHPDLTLEMVREEIISDPTSPWAKKWELLQPFARGERKGAFAKEAFLLQKEGEISSVVDTKDGKAIIQLVRRIPRTYKPLSTVSNEIKTILAEKQFKKHFVKDIKAIVMQGDAQGVESFIAQKAGKKEMVLGVIKNDTRLAQEIFSLKKGEYGFFVEGDTGLVVLLTDITERHLPEYDSIKDIVKNDLHEERAYDTMVHAVQKAKEAATEMSFDQLAKEFGASLHHTGMIQPNDNKKIQELDKKGLPAKMMLGLDKVGATLVHNSDRISFLVKVDAIEEYSQNDLEASKKEILTHLESNRTKMQVESVIASLHRNATIETNESTQIPDEEYSE